MSKPVKFGREASPHPTFQINDLVFSSLPLSLSEEQELAKPSAALAEGEDDSMDDILEILASILNARVEDKATTITSHWLMANLTPEDFVGILDLLRGK